VATFGSGKDTLYEPTLAVAGHSVAITHVRQYARAE